MTTSSIQYFIWPPLVPHICRRKYHTRIRIPSPRNLIDFDNRREEKSHHPFGNQTSTISSSLLPSLSPPPSYPKPRIIFSRYHTTSPQPSELLIYSPLYYSRLHLTYPSFLVRFDKSATQVLNMSFVTRESKLFVRLWIWGEKVSGIEWGVLFSFLYSLFSKYHLRHSLRLDRFSFVVWNQIDLSRDPSLSFNASYLYFDVNYPRFLNFVRESGRVVLVLLLGGWDRTIDRLWNMVLGREAGFWRFRGEEMQGRGGTRGSASGIGVEG